MQMTLWLCPQNTTISGAAPFWRRFVRCIFLFSGRYSDALRAVPTQGTGANEPWSESTRYLGSIGL